ncbi:hypothetical protein D3C81_2085920 [compost metagenome]
MPGQPVVKGALGLLRRKPLGYQQIVLRVERHVKMAVRLFNAVEARVERLTTQAGHGQNSAVALLEEMAHGGKPDGAMIGRNRIERHFPIDGVN